MAGPRTVAARYDVKTLRDLAVKIRPITKSSASTKVFETLREMIASGQFRPGDKLPSQDELATQFGVSRNTLREAINRLTIMGLVTPKHGVGTKVNDISPSRYMSSLSDFLFLQPGTVRELLEARIYVERATVRLAATRMKNEDFAELKSLLSQQAETFQRGDVDAFIELDREFHIALARGSGNAVLLKFLETIKDLLSNFIREVAYLPGALESAIKYHTEILGFLNSRKPQEAAEKVFQHLRDVAKRIERAKGVRLDIEAVFEPQVGKHK